MKASALHKPRHTLGHRATLSLNCLDTTSSGSATGSIAPVPAAMSVPLSGCATTFLMPWYPATPTPAKTPGWKCGPRVCPTSPMKTMCSSSRTQTRLSCRICSAPWIPSLGVTACLNLSTQNVWPRASVKLLHGHPEISRAMSIRAADSCTRPMTTRPQQSCRNALAMSSPDAASHTFIRRWSPAAARAIGLRVALIEGDASTGKWQPLAPAASNQCTVFPHGRPLPHARQGDYVGAL